MGKNIECSKRLRISLDKADMKQIELSQLTGIPKSAISQYLSGKVIPKQDKIYLMAKALNISELWLMGYTTEDGNGALTSAHAPALTFQEEQLLTDFRSLSSAGQSDAQRYVRMLKRDEEDLAKKDERNFG